jgi:quercetin dioxygenase-like cupin family protein
LARWRLPTPSSLPSPKNRALPPLPDGATSENLSFPSPPPTGKLPLVDLDSAPAYPRIEFPNLFQLVEKEDEIPWRPFKEGVEIHRLYGDGITGPTAALLRFQPGGKVPLHEHPGYEHIFVLSGTQRDNVGSAGAGALIVTPPGTRHCVVSDTGCIVLAIYEKPVRFVQDGEVAAAAVGATPPGARPLGAAK